MRFSYCVLSLQRYSSGTIMTSLTEAHMKSKLDYLLMKIGDSFDNDEIFLIESNVDGIREEEMVILHNAANDRRKYLKQSGLVDRREPTLNKEKLALNKESYKPDIRSIYELSDGMTICLGSNGFNVDQTSILLSSEAMNVNEKDKIFDPQAVIHFHRLDRGDNLVTRTLCNGQTVQYSPEHERLIDGFDDAIKENYFEKKQ